jgi:glycerol-3-phosphate acyltransferase PlsY
VLLEIASILVGYMLGSIPAAFIVAKLRKGIDIREVGRGNMGAVNVMREVGMWEGALVAVVDVGKGAAAIIFGQALGVSQPWLLGAGGAAVLGHSFPVYIGFRGGQGVATVIGVVLVLSPVVTGIACGIIGVALLLTRHIFASIVIAAPFFPLIMWLVERSPTLVLFALAIVLFIGFRSRRGLKELIVTIRDWREMKKKS